MSAETYRPLVDSVDGATIPHVTVSLDNASLAQPSTSRTRKIACVSITAVALVVAVLVITLPLVLTPRPRITAQQVMQAAIGGAPVSVSGQSQTVVIAEDAANMVLAALAQALSSQSITIAGATIQEVSGTTASAELEALDPILASLPVSTDNTVTLYVASGVCGNVVGLSNVQCALIAYDPAIGSNPSALLQDAHAILAVMVGDGVQWSPAQLPQLQSGDTSALSCVSWSGGGTLVGAAQAVSVTGLVQGLNFAVAGSGSTASSQCPLNYAFGQLVTEQMSISNLFALVTMPYNNWLAGAQLTVTVAQGSFAISAETDTVSAVLNNVQLTVVGLSSVSSVQASGQVVMTLPNTQPLVFNAQGSWTSQQLQLSGNTPGWAPNPFGLTFLSLGATQFSYSVTPNSWSTQFQSTLLLHDAGGSDSMTVTGIVQGSGFALQVQDGSISSLLDVLCGAVGAQCPTNILADLSLTDPSVTVQLASASLQLPYTGSTPAVGFTITATTQLTGQLLATMQARLAGFPSSSNVQLSAFVPVFNMANLVQGTVITLSLPTFAFNSQVSWNGFQVTLQPLVADLAATGSIQLNLPSQPSQPLIFAVTGDLQINAAVGAQVQLTGQMQGTWQNAFGVSGLSVSNVVLSAMIANGVPSFGVASSVQIGTVQASFAGDFDVGAGEIGVSASVSNLELSDMISFYNSVSGAQMSTPPGANLGFSELSVSLSTFTGSMGSVQFQQGLSFVADAVIFGNTVDVSMSPSYAFTFQFDNTAVQTSFLSEVETVLGYLWSKIEQYIANIFSVSGFNLQNFSLANLEQGTLPSLCVSGVFLDQNFNECEPLSSLVQFGSDIHTVLTQLEILLDPQCIVNENCSNNAYCNHDSSNGQVFTCVAGCPNGCDMVWGCVNNGGAACN